MTQILHGVGKTATFWELDRHGSVTHDCKDLLNMREVIFDILIVDDEIIEIKMARLIF